MSFAFNVLLLHLQKSSIEQRMKKIVTFLGVSWMSLSAVAQTDTITGRVHQLEEVTITETQRKHTVTSTAPLHLLDRQDMLTMGVTDIADALHRLPGITIRDYGGAGGMKTVSVRGFGAKHTGVCYDGVMLSECQSGEIDLSRYSLDNVDNLSLVIGDNDDIFIPARQVTTPAVLNIQTLRLPTADTRPHLTTQVKFGSFGYVSPFLRYEQNFSDKFAFSAVGEYTYAENDYPYELRNGLQTIHDRRTNNRMNSGHGELNFLWSINAVNRLSGKIYYYDNDRQLPGLVRYYTNLSGENLRDRNFFAQMMYQTRWGEQLSLKWNTKFNWSASIYEDALKPGGINDASYWQREVYTSMALLYAPDDHWTFDYSADYAFNNLNGSSWRAVTGRPSRHTILQSATAKYHNKRLTVLGRLLYSLYLNEQRDVPDVDRIDIQKNSASNMRRLSPSVSLSYRLLESYDLYVRASYKNIFRSPTFNESYFYHYGSPNLQPELTDQYNIGVTFSHTRSKNWHLYLTLDGYYNHVKDMIVAIPYNMFIWTCVNIGKVYTYGMDATIKASYRFSPRYALLFSGNYSYQKVENRFNPESPNYKKQIAYMPKHTGSLALTFENPWVNVSLHGVGVSSRWPNNDHYSGTMIDGYMDFGVTAYRQLTFGRHQIEARLDLKNLFNTQYEIVSHYPMPRRSYQITINYKF